jgi:SAM-dependent methyltransferase
MLRRRAADFNSVFSQYLDRSARVSRVLSLCCGHGHFERTILQLLSYDHCDSLDISEPALEHARELAREAGILNVNYERCDVNTLQLSQEYDLVFGGGIHHLSNLEHVFSEVARWLCPGAPFMMYEYIGPNRCQPTERQLEAINACIRLLPEKYRMRVSAQREMNVGSADEAMDILRRKRADMRGLSDCDNTDRFSSDPLFAKFFWQRYTPMTVEQWQTVDPSESVRSEDILPVLRQYFSDVDVRYQGGSILQFTLFDLAANFCYESPEVRALLKMLIHVEDVLTTFDPDIPQDYAVIIARNP